MPNNQNQGYSIYYPTQGTFNLNYDQIAQQIYGSPTNWMNTLLSQAPNGSYITMPEGGTQYANQGQTGLSQNFLNQYYNPTSNISNLQTQLNDILAAQQSALGSQQQSAIQGIQSGYGQQAAQMQQAFTQQTGAQKAVLGRIGALGTTSRSTQQQQQMTSEQQGAMAQLEQAKQAAIGQANSAYQQGQLDLATQSFNAAIQFENMQQQAQQNALSNLFQMAGLTGEFGGQPTMQAQQFQWQQNQQAIENQLASDKFNFEKQISQGNMDINTIQLLTSIPQGQTVTIGGKQYSGLMGITPDYWLQTSEDAGGNVTLISVDKATGQVSTQNLGKIGKGFKATGDGGGLMPTSTNQWSPYITFDETTGTAIIDQDAIAQAFPQNQRAQAVQSAWQAAIEMETQWKTAQEQQQQQQQQQANAPYNQFGGNQGWGQYLPGANTASSVWNWLNNLWK